ncbi:MAG: helix-turn-helix domain-containing protein [Lachnospiraceae bacterium]|nr:helix-turn-helix domain-containing protein [Lachnospiraceae bacterium]
MIKEVQTTMNVSLNIKSLRGLKQLTQDDLAEKLHVTRQTISNWETGKSEPDFESLETLAGVFGVSVSELLGEDKGAAQSDQTSDAEGVTAQDSEESASETDQTSEDQTSADQIYKVNGTIGKGRKILIGILGLLGLLTLLNVLFIEPQLLEYTGTTYDAIPRMINELAVIPAGCFFFGMLIPACLMLKNRPKLKRSVRFIIIAVSALLLIPLIWINLHWALTGPEMTGLKQVWFAVFNSLLFDGIRRSIVLHLMPFLSGLLLMTGILSGRRKKTAGISET